MIDTREVKKHVDLLALVGPSTHLRKIAGTRGGEYAGSCPFCGGNDRFRVQPNADPPQWWCRSCSPDHRWQDAIAFVMKRDSLDFAAACAVLGDTASVDARSGGRAKASIDALALGSRASLWHSRAELFIVAAEETLWSDLESGRLALMYLRNRGLSDATIRHWRLGWHAATTYEQREQWGLPMETDRRKSWIPRGIVIPWAVDGRLRAVKLRRPDVDVRSTGDKYIALAGSSPVLFGADLLNRHPCAILLESELDAILTDQEAGDLIGVAATGSAKGMLPPEAIAHFLPVSRLLVAYNADAAGEQAAGRLLKLTARARRVLVPMGKDPTEMHQQGGRIRDWAALLAVKHGLPDKLAQSCANKASQPDEIQVQQMPEPNGVIQSIPDRLCRDGCGNPVEHQHTTLCGDCSRRQRASIPIPVSLCEPPPEWSCTEQGCKAPAADPDRGQRFYCADHMQQRPRLTSSRDDLVRLLS